MFMEKSKYALARVALMAILMAGMLGIHSVQAEAVDFGQAQDMSGTNLDYGSANLRGGGGPEPATLIGPMGANQSNMPTYAWYQVQNATWYQLWVSGPSGAVLKIWYTPQAANCNGVYCMVTPTKVSMVSGSYTWGVQT